MPSLLVVINFNIFKYALAHAFSIHERFILNSFNFFKPSIEQVPLNINDNAILSRLDINPQQTRILLLSKNYDDSSSLYQLNIENYAQRHYHTFAAIVRNAIWQHDGEGVFYTTPPPAQKLMAINAVKNISQP